MALFLVPFTLFWVRNSMYSAYGTQLKQREFDLELSIFGLPFLLVSICLVFLTLMTLFGRTNISCDSGRAHVFIGIGSVGWCRRFDWNSIVRVVEYNTMKYSSLSLVGVESINFGWALNSEQKYFLSNYVRTKLENQSYQYF